MSTGTPELQFPAAELFVRKLVEERLSAWRTGMLSIIGVMVTLFVVAATYVMSSIHSKVEAKVETAVQTQVATAFGQQQAALDTLQGQLNTLKDELNRLVGQASEQGKGIASHLQESQRLNAELNKLAGDARKQSEELAKLGKQVQERIKQDKDDLVAALKGDSDFREQVSKAAVEKVENLSRRVDKLDGEQVLTGVWTFKGNKTKEGNSARDSLILQTPYGLLLKKSSSHWAFGKSKTATEFVVYANDGWTEELTGKLQPDGKEIVFTAPNGTEARWIR
jgi:flagellar motility protein MotE (MotC chaperone)